MSTFALKKRIRVIYINGIRIELHNFEQYYESMPKSRGICLLSYTNDAGRIALIKNKPFNVSKDSLTNTMDQPIQYTVKMTQCTLLK